MEWWVYLLVFLTLLFSVFTIYFSFIQPSQVRKKKLSSDLKKHPNKIVLSPSDVKLFVSFKITDLDKMPVKQEYEQGGVFGFYVDKKMHQTDDFFPIYLTQDQENLWTGILNTKTELLADEVKFSQVYDYLKKHHYNIKQVSFFIIEDYNLENFPYWEEILETKTSGFNK